MFKLLCIFTARSVSHHLYSVWEIWLEENLCERRRRAGEHKGVVYTKWGWCPLLKGYRQDADECRRDGCNSLTSPVTAADWSFVKTLFRLCGFVQCRMICDGSQEWSKRATRLCRCASCLVFGWFSVRIVTGATEFSDGFSWFLSISSDKRQNGATARDCFLPNLFFSFSYHIQAIQNTVNTSTQITKTPTRYKSHTYTHPHITKQVKTATVQDTHQIKQSQYNQVPSV
jgi:hypothetical protein